jgi:membrane protease YdiL (CAAX protease family)
MTNNRTRSINLVEMAVVGMVALLVIGVGWKLVGEGALARQMVVWVANITMLLTIWGGLRLRGQSTAHFGLHWSRRDRPSLGRTLWQSILVFLAGMAGFLVGSVVAGMVMGGPPGAGSDMSGYEYLQGNLPMLVLAMAAVLIASSFGEEFIYRGFLMTRVAEMVQEEGRKAMVSAVLVSAVVFGLIHFGWGLFGIIQTTFMGLALAVSYLRVGRNLWALVLAHAYMDIMLLVQLYLGGGGSG